MTTSAPPPGIRPRPYQSARTARASPTSGVMTTPLPAARPSAFTTIGPFHSSSAPFAASSECTTTARAVGMPWRSMNRFAKILLDSRRPAERLGPKTAMPASRKRSPTPAAIAVSGPSTTRSICSASTRSANVLPSVAAISQFSPREAVPALPGAAKIAPQDGDCARRQESASSRAPLPTTRMRTFDC